MPTFMPTRSIYAPGINVDATPATTPAPDVENTPTVDTTPVPETETAAETPVVEDVAVVEHATAVDTTPVPETETAAETATVKATTKAKKIPSRRWGRAALSVMPADGSPTSVKAIHEAIVAAGLVNADMAKAKTPLNSLSRDLRDLARVSGTGIIQTGPGLFARG